MQEDEVLQLLCSSWYSWSWYSWYRIISCYNVTTWLEILIQPWLYYISYLQLTY